MGLLQKALAVATLVAALEDATAGHRIWPEEGGDDE